MDGCGPVAGSKACCIGCVSGGAEGKAQAGRCFGLQPIQMVLTEPLAGNCVDCECLWCCGCFVLFKAAEGLPWGWRLNVTHCQLGVKPAAFLRS